MPNDSEAQSEASGRNSSESLNERIYQDIKKLILSNRLRPGHKLGHWELANMFDVSRTPVREALERLYQERYVKRIPRRGFFVAEIATEEAKDLYEAREALELYALRQSLNRGASVAELKAMKKIQREYEGLVKERRTNDRGRVDRDFHLHLASLGGNDYIVRSLAAIFERLLLKRRSDGYFSDRGDQAAAEHAELITALEQGKATEAERLLGGHIQRAWLAFERHLMDIGG